MLSLPKLLVIGLVIAAVYYIFFRKPAQKTDNTTTDSGASKNDKKLDDVMVECAKCGTFVSSKEALIKDGQYFCSKECAGL